MFDLHKYIILDDNVKLKKENIYSFIIVLFIILILFMIFNTSSNNYKNPIINKNVNIIH